MHSKKESLLKRWHSFRADPEKCGDKWRGQYWKEQDDYRIISCRDCRSFNQQKSECSINFGTPLRKCVVSSIEAHFNNCRGQDVLEIGYGRFKLAKNLIQRSGGTWTGIEPRRPKNEKSVLGKGGYGHATEIPFPENTFDRVFAVQSVEHWGQRAGGVREPSSYADCFAEINRVLKPGGSVYLDAPVHFHGNEMFIMGDTEKLQGFFSNDQWANVKIEKWREDYYPLERYTPAENEFRDWPIEITSYSEGHVAEAKANGVVWLITLVAEKTALMS